MNKEEERLISYNYNELGQEFGDLIVDIRNERDKYKEVLDKIKEKLEKDNKEAVDFTHKIETSDLQQGGYPVHYYRMLWNKELTEKYLELLEEIE